MLMKINQINIFFLLAALFLIRLPPFYFFLIDIDIFTSHNFTRLLILISFIFLNLILYKSKDKILHKKKIFYLLLIYFFTQSLSVFGAKNINSFLLIYKNLFFSLMFFFISFFIINKNLIKTVFKILILTSFINVIYQLSFYFFSDQIRSYLDLILYKPHLQFLYYLHEKNKYFVDSFDELIIPGLIYYIIKTRKKFNKFLIIFLLLSVIFITFISNSRTKFILLLFSLFCSFFIFKKNFKRLVLLFLFIFIFFYSFNLLLSSKRKFNVIDRMLLKEEIDVKTIKSRFNYWREALDIGKSSFLIGVGLGNYFDNLTEVSKKANLNNVIAPYKFIVIDDPHNLFFSTFANSGILGLISLSLLAVCFFINDLHSIIYLRRNIYLYIFLVFFWGMFIHAFFNPWMYYSFLSLFFFIRGVIEKINFR